MKLGVLVLIGLSFDALVFVFGGLQFVPEPQFGWLPSWLVAIWFLFGVGLSLLEVTFRKKYLWAALAGALMGPLSYKSGETFGVLFLRDTYVLMAYVGFWAAYFPFAIFWISRK